MSPDNSRIFLYPGQMAVSRSGQTLVTLLGSCCSVILLDRRRKIGGMNHYLLANHDSRDQGQPGRYGSLAIPRLVKEMLRQGAEKSDLRAQLFGGAKMFQHFNKSKDIGQSNIEIGREILKAFEIPIEVAHVGGTKGLRIHLDTSSLEVSYRLHGSKIEPSVPSRQSRIDGLLGGKPTFRSKRQSNVDSILFSGGLKPQKKG